MIGAGTAQVNQWPVGGLQHLGEREACRLAHLLPRIDLLPRLAVAGTEIPIVEHDRAEAGASKRLGEGIQALLLHGSSGRGGPHP